MSTANLFPAWKQEINRRVAAHMSQKTPLKDESGGGKESGTAPSGRAAQAAARVAERYAHAPSYSEMLADEARAAMRAAEAASKAAQQAHEAVQYVLAGIEAVSPEAAAPASSSTREVPESLVFDESPLFSHGVREEGTARAADPAQYDSRSGLEPGLGISLVEAPAEDQGAEAAQPIYANLIQFPREMVATRKMRPRRAEGPLAATAPEAQLSIFEVDPASISTQPEVEGLAAPAWMRTELSGEVETRSEAAADEIEEPVIKSSEQATIKLAPLSRRLMAIAVDLSLVIAVFSAATITFALTSRYFPSVRTIEICAALAVFAIGIAYHWMCFWSGRATPGMLYAGIALCNFDGSSPSRAQRFKRVLALPLSMLPLCLGLLWALFDDNHFTWHDRLSRTYPRKR